MPYTRWLRSTHDLISRYSSVYGPSYYEATEAADLVVKTSSPLASGVFWETLSPGDNEESKSLVADIRTALARHFETSTSELLKASSELAELAGTEPSSADVLATQTVNSIIMAYTEVRAQRPARPRQFLRRRESE